MEEKKVREYSDELMQIVEVFRQKIIAGTSDPEAKSNAGLTKGNMRHI